jgi:type IV pilus assembly protein PilQ
MIVLSSWFSVLSDLCGISAYSAVKFFNHREHGILLQSSRRIKILTIFILLSTSLFSQDRFTYIETKLKELSLTSPGLTEKVELSVNGAMIQDFIRGLATTNGLNVSVDAPLTIKIYNNFSNVTVSEVLLFLCKKYDLDITFIGNIMSVTAFQVPPQPIVKYTPKVLKINYDKVSGLLTVDLSGDTLSHVMKELTRQSGMNVVFTPELANKTVSGFIQGLSFGDALDKLAFANSLKITPSGNTFFIEKGESTKPLLVKSGTSSPQPGLNIQVDNGMVTVDAKNIPMSDIINAVSSQLNHNYFLFSEPKGITTLSVTNVTFDDFLGYLLNGTDFTFRKNDQIYLIGDRNLEGLRATKVVQLKYRTVDKVLEMIPADLKKNVELKTFPDLNSLIISGSQPRIDEINSFLLDIDKVVPNIVIEVILADIRDTKTVSTGIEAGLGPQPKSTGGQVYPSVDLTLNSNTINQIIAGINGFGIVNLGNVTPNFYINLKALESQGLLTMNSTPKLSTLNGHVATLSIGETEYYLETSNNVIGSQNPQNIITQTYKSVNADLSITINPIVSGDDQITLEITVKQSSFTARINPNAPPGTITREFKSLIRVKNGETIILGGLEENSKSDTGSGLPFLSRIPVIKWLFSSRTKTKSKDKLTIFIKPTVVY